MSNLTFDGRISAGSIINFILMLCAVTTIFFQQNYVHEQAVREAQLQKDSLSALGQRVGDLSDRIQALSLSDTQRFTSLDDTLKQLSLRVDSLQSNIQSLSDRLVIQEAKVAALQDEIKTIVSSKQRQ